MDVYLDADWKKVKLAIFFVSSKDIPGRNSTKHTIALLLQIWEQLRPIVEVRTWRNTPDRTKAVDFHICVGYNLFLSVLYV